MPFRPRLRHYAGALVVVAIGVAVFLAVGREAPISTSGFTPFSIGSIDLSSIEPQEPTDYLALVETFDGSSFNVRAEHGKKCATATNDTACRTELSEILSSSGIVTFSQCGTCPRLTLIGTRGDQVFAVGDLSTFLGRIDTPTEAALAASVGSWVKPVDGGYEVIESHFTAECDPIIEVTTLSHVGADGTVIPLDTHTTRENGVCI